MNYARQLLETALKDERSSAAFLAVQSAKVQQKVADLTHALAVLDYREVGDVYGATAQDYRRYEVECMRIAVAVVSSL